MEGEVRREKIIECLNKSRNPMSGTELAKLLGVSRQVIVQDIALLRAVNKNILSTNKGYIMHNPLADETKFRRTIRVHHTDEETRDELYTIVDYGGKVLDVVVEHDLYGQLSVDLILKNRQDVDEFMTKMHDSTDQPLKVLTNGSHLHTIEADSKLNLDAIEQKLKVRGYAK